MDLFCDATEVTRRYGRYVDDLRRLFVFHGLSCGSAEDFGMLAAKLADSKAFSTDVAALVRSIRDLEAGAISADQMLTAIALASAGEALVEGRAGSATMGRTVGMLRMFLAGVGGWNESSEPEERSAAGEPGLNGPPPPDAALLDPAPVRRRWTEGFIARSLEISTAAREYPDAVAFEPEAPLRPELASTPPPPSETWSGVRDGAPAAPTEFDQGGRVHMARPPIVFSTAPATPTTPVSEPLETSRSSAPSLAPIHELAPAPRFLAPAPPFQDPAPPHLEPAMPHARDTPPAPAQPAMLTDDPAPVWPQRAVEPVGSNYPEKSLRERLGRLLGIAAVVLAALGLIGLAISYRSPQPPGETAQRTNPSKSQNTTSQQSPNASSEAPPTDTARLSSPTSPGPIEDTANTSSPNKQPNHPQPNHPDTPSASELPPPPSKPVDTSSPAAATEPAPHKQPEPTRPHATAQKLHTPAKATPHEPKPAREPKPTLAASPKREPAATATARPAHKDTPTTTPAPAASPASGSEVVSGGRVRVPEAAMRRNLLSVRQPVYPPDALKQNVEGSVVLNAFIARDGTVKRMDVVRGPTVFIKSALSAVSWRRYKPYLVQGKPVEVETPITVTYTVH